MKGSRFIEGLWQTASWNLVSMKSGPHLKGWTTLPLLVSAAMRERLIVVLPLADVGAEMRNIFRFTIYNLRFTTLC